MSSGFDQALSPFLHKADIRRLMEIAFVSLEVGEPIYAEGIFEGLLAIVPDDPSFVFGFALSLLSEQRYEDAVIFLKNHEELCQVHEALGLLLCLSLRDFGYFHESEQQVSSLTQRSNHQEIITLLHFFFGQGARANKE